MSPAQNIDDLLRSADGEITASFELCTESAPNFGVRKDCFVESLGRTIEKYLAPASAEPLTPADVAQFLDQLQIDDLFMAIACAKGSERAWWEFDQQHRTYMERVARHLAKTEADAQELSTVITEAGYTPVSVEAKHASAATPRAGGCCCGSGASRCCD